MSSLVQISLRRWQMGRIAFALHLGAIALCLLGFALTNGVWPWLGIIALTLGLPVSQSMRLNRMGRSPYWPFLPLIGVAVLVFQLFLGIAAVSGTPGGAPTTSEQATTFVGVICLGLMALIAAFCLLPDHWRFRPLANEGLQ